MKKAILVLLVILFLGATISPAFAGGDKNRNRHEGGNGKGKVNQHQVNK